MVRLLTTLTGKWLITHPHRGLSLKAFINKHQSPRKVSNVILSTISTFINVPNSFLIFYDLQIKSNNRWPWITIHLGLTKSALRKFSTPLIFHLSWSTCVPFFLVYIYVYIFVFFLFGNKVSFLTMIHSSLFCRSYPFYFVLCPRVNS